jgi:hypothetical protein
LYPKFFESLPQIDNGLSKPGLRGLRSTHGPNKNSNHIVRRSILQNLMDARIATNSQILREQVKHGIALS